MRFFFLTPNTGKFELQYSCNMIISPRLQKVITYRRALKKHSKRATERVGQAFSVKQFQLNSYQRLFQLTQMGSSSWAQGQKTLHTSYSFSLPTLHMLFFFLLIRTSIIRLQKTISVKILKGLAPYIQDNYFKQHICINIYIASWKFSEVTPLGENWEALALNTSPAVCHYWPVP